MAKNLIFGFEYLYVNLGDEIVTMSGPQDDGTVTSRVNVDSNIHTVRANLRYKF